MKNKRTTTLIFYCRKGGNPDEELSDSEGNQYRITD